MSSSRSAVDCQGSGRSTSLAALLDSKRGLARCGVCQKAVPVTIDGRTLRHAA